jgi:hypothetical protein
MFSWVSCLTFEESEQCEDSPTGKHVFSVCDDEDPDIICEYCRMSLM